LKHLTPGLSGGPQETTPGATQKRPLGAVRSEPLLDHADVARLPVSVGPTSALILEVHSRRGKCFFRGAIERTIVKHTWLIFLVTVGIEGKRPDLFVPKVTEPT
jgi:hypothetical protein